MLLPGNRHSRVLLRPRSGRIGTGAEGGQMDDRADARSYWLFLLSPVFAMAGQQNSHAALGTGDHALRARRTLQTVVGSCPCREAKGPYYRGKRTRALRHACLEGGLLPAREWVRRKRVVSQGKSLRTGLRNHRRGSDLPAPDARRGKHSLRVSARIWVRAVLGVFVYMVDISTARLSRYSGL